MVSWRFVLRVHIQQGTNFVSYYLLPILICIVLATFRGQHPNNISNTDHKGEPEFPNYSTSGIDALSACHQFGA